MKASLLTLLGSASTAFAVKGFNYASNGQNQASFSNQFRTAAGLAGTSELTSARLYTMVQDGTANTPISAIPAAIDTKTTLLLGLWASQDQNGFNNELAALKAAISQYGQQFADLVVGISVGSEDLYRISPTGIANGENPGQEPSVLVNYIGQVREAVKGTILSSKPIGHVDTWNVYVNGSNANVISNCDFLGLDEYPYFQTTDPNSIENAGNIFFQSYDRVAAVAQGKPIWITEAGWPTAGPASGQAVASVQNAETFWQDVYCELGRRNINTWWYILADDGASPSFGVSSNGQPKYSLTCTAKASSSSSTTVASSTSSVAVGSSSTTAGGAGSTSITTSVIPGVVTTTASVPTSAGVRPSTTTSAATTSYTGAASKMENSLVGLVAAAAVAFAL